MQQSFVATALPHKGPISLRADIADMCIMVFHHKSFVIVTPRYLMLSTFSMTVPSRVYEAFRFLVTRICITSHHIAFHRLKSQTPFPCIASQLIYIFLKFQCALCILNFSVANTVIHKETEKRTNFFENISFRLYKVCVLFSSCFSFRV